MSSDLQEYECTWVGGCLCARLCVRVCLPDIGLCGTNILLNEIIIIYNM